MRVRAGPVHPAADHAAVSPSAEEERRNAGTRHRLRGTDTHRLTHPSTPTAAYQLSCRTARGRDWTVDGRRISHTHACRKFLLVSKGCNLQVSIPRSLHIEHLLFKLRQGSRGPRQAAVGRVVGAHNFSRKAQRPIDCLPAHRQEEKEQEEAVG